jgi:nitrate/nitrite-specific signal transduction histidine kinase
MPNPLDMSTPFSTEDLNLLYEVSTSIHAIKDFDEMLSLVLHKIKEVFQIDGASLALHQPDRKMESITISRKCIFRIISASPAGCCATTGLF